MTDKDLTAPEAVERVARAAEAVAGLRILTPEQSEAVIDAVDCLRALSARVAELEGNRKALEASIDDLSDQLEAAHGQRARAEAAEAALAKADALADSLDEQATHRISGMPHNPAMPKAFRALTAYRQAKDATP